MYNRGKFHNDLMWVLRKHRIANNDSMISAIDSVLIAADESSWVANVGDWVKVHTTGFTAVHYDEQNQPVSDGREFKIPVGAVGEVIEITHDDKSHYDAEMKIAVRFRTPSGKRRTAILYCAGDEGLLRLAKKPRGH